VQKNKWGVVCLLCALEWFSSPAYGTAGHLGVGMLLFYIIMPLGLLWAAILDGGLNGHNNLRQEVLSAR